MAPDRLRSPLYHSVPKPASRPAPLWQVAAALDPTTRQREKTVSHAPLPVASPREPLEIRRPQTSAILAGWVCVGIGLLTAWIFPLANGFFSIAIILAIVAMATHQIRDGLLLLAGSVGALGFSVLLFVLGLAALVFHTVSKLPELKPLPTPGSVSLRTPAPSVATRGPVTVGGIVGGAPTARPVPLTLAEVSAMISAGRDDGEIISAVYSRPLLGRLGASEATTLRAYGASDRLMDVLRARFPADNPPPVYQTAVSATPPPVARTPAPVQAPRVTTSTPAAPTPVDYAARDRQIADLKSRMEALDEQVRRVREHPADYRSYGNYASSGYHGVDQAKLDAYLKELDRQRDDLRRQKWALEGR